MKKLTINNRKGQGIVVVVSEVKKAKGLAILMHGLSGNKEQPYIVTIADAFQEKGYTTLRFDTTNTFGESDGRYEDATVTSYFYDLEDVIAWSKTQSWFVYPFILVGHSLGGISVILYAEKHPEDIKALAPISSVISGKLSLESPMYRDIWDQWKKTGWREQKRSSVLGRIKRLPWSHMVNRLEYDVLKDVQLLTMPVLLVVGENDEGTPYEHQKLFYDKLTGKKEIHLIKNAPHTFTQSSHLEKLREIFLKWIDTT